MWIVGLTLEQHFVPYIAHNLAETSPTVLDAWETAPSALWGWNGAPLAVVRRPNSPSPVLSLNPPRKHQLKLARLSTQKPPAFEDCKNPFALVTANTQKTMPVAYWSYLAQNHLILNHILGPLLKTILTQFSILHQIKQAKQDTSTLQSSNNYSKDDTRNHDSHRDRCARCDHGASIFDAWHA